MTRYAESRADRRLAARQKARAEAEPREVEDRREEARRVDPPLTGKALDKRLRELGITADRRRGERRSRGDRRSPR